METKKCSNCGRELPIEKFHTWMRKDGTIGVLHQCLKCQSHKAYIKQCQKKRKNSIEKIESEILINELIRRGVLKDGVITY
jgi:hypothetical protein